jgi:hypothetical protein
MTTIAAAAPVHAVRDMVTLNENVRLPGIARSAEAGTPGPETNYFTVRIT